MLLEKEQFNTKINNLIQTNQNLSKNINLIKKANEDKKNLLINKQTQTEQIINPKLKELLYKHKISEEDINLNNFSKIISQLIIGMETMSNDANIYNAKLKK